MQSSGEAQEGRGAAPETRRGDGGLPGMGGFRARGLPGGSGTRAGAVSKRCPFTQPEGGTRLSEGAERPGAGRGGQPGYGSAQHS